MGSLVPKKQSCWQDPVPAVDHKLIGERDIAALKKHASRIGTHVSQLVATAWASAATFRGTDKRGGANGARIRLAPQKDWAVNQPEELAKVLKALKRVQADFNRSQSGGKKVSLADLIVLGGCAAVEKAAKDAGHKVKVPIRSRPHRRDRRVRPTLNPSPCSNRSPMVSATTSNRNWPYRSEALLVDRAQLLTLTAPEMTVLVGGLRVLDANVGQSQLGVFTKRPGKLTNDFFVNLLAMNIEWKKSTRCEYFYEGSALGTAR